ncbi:uncharacterized protein LOC143179294 [Calliopsis andreniformis]|uniref:uncharacterized protein LOC143179294 n=1 Tax=Calliopsis andreniformis TaxID=337506 RepID=UPI003FCDA49D
MLLFTLLGALLFGITVAILVSVYLTAAFWYILTMLILCCLMCIFFLLEIAMIMMFWKRKYRCCKECCSMDRTEVLKGDFCHPLCSETVKYDQMTSISSLTMPSRDEEGIPDHSQRKIGYGRRRQYVDCPTSARTKSVVDIVEVQTELHATSTIGSQTQRELKESPVQTVSKCELCNRQLQFPSSSGTVQPTTQSPCAPCPALVQLIRGVSCCPGCRCVAGIVQMPQQSQQQQTQRQDQQEQSGKDQVQWVQPIDDKSYGVLTSEKARVDQALT